MTTATIDTTASDTTAAETENKVKYTNKFAPSFIKSLKAEAEEQGVSANGLIEAAVKAAILVKPGTEDFIVNDQFKTLLPELSDEERANLEASVLKDGVKDALIVWRRPDGSKVLADGHNRYGICSKHGIAFPVKEREFADEQAVSDWIEENQASRRNVTANWWDYFMGKKYNATKAQGGNGGGQTSEAIAAEMGVGEATVRRNARYQKSVDEIAKNTSPEVKRELLDGKLGLDKKQVADIAKQPAKEQKQAIDLAKTKAAEQKKATEQKKAKAKAEPKAKASSHSTTDAKPEPKDKVKHTQPSRLQVAQLHGALTMMRTDGVPMATQLWQVTDRDGRTWELPIPQSLADALKG